MKLALRNDYSFTLTLIGYQFPELKDEPYDSDWLNVRIDVRHPDGSWSTTDPALLTYEVQELANWFRDLAAGKRTKRNLGFLEPCLEFDLRQSEGSVETLEVTLAHEFRPPWSTEFEDKFEMTFPLASIDLVEAAESLERELARYPQRTAR